MAANMNAPGGAGGVGAAGREPDAKASAAAEAGQTNKEIAAAVFLAEETVKNYVSSILAKLGLDRRTQVPAFVAEHETGRPEEEPR
jgi:succinyl-CoA synthetase beta subunit